MADEGRDWSELPGDLTAMILQKLGQAELLERAQMVCKTWRQISKEPSFWRSIDCNLFEGSDSRREMMIRRAVDLSRGQLVEIKFFEIRISGRRVLPYIAERASQLRCLDTRLCSVEDWMEAARKLPCLEELHMSGRYAPAPLLRVIGSCCQHLKSLRLVKDLPYIGENTSDREAREIGKNMPGLRHLELSAQKLTRRGLQAILDGCPHLQSLTLFGRSRHWVLDLAKVDPIRFLFGGDEE